jgi:hypothetical protein
LLQAVTEEVQPLACQAEPMQIDGAVGEGQAEGNTTEDNRGAKEEGEGEPQPEILQPGNDSVAAAPSVTAAPASLSLRPSVAQVDGDQSGDPPHLSLPRPAFGRS